MNEEKKTPSKEERLAASKDMAPVDDSVELDIPVEELWECFSQAHLWPRWNRCFFSVRTKELELGKQLVWTFEPIRRYYLYKMPAAAKIVELEDGRKVTWEVTILPGFYARHTYYMEDLGNGRSRFGSWEKAMGPSFRLMKRFWVAHFWFVNRESLAGAKRLEQHYRRAGTIDPETLPPRTYGWFVLTTVLFLLLIAAAVLGGMFYTEYVRLTSQELAPGVTALYGGGGNSLLVEGEDESLLIDSKFPPGSDFLRHWIEEESENPVRHVVNTHYHYDHIQGNPLYPDATFYAAEPMPSLVRLRDPRWWSSNRDAVPSGDGLISGNRSVFVGDREIVLYSSAAAHTHGDLWAYLPSDEIVVTGDLFFNDYYPFIDLGEGGASLKGWIETIRAIAARHPDARYLPGHGPVAGAEELLGFADYLEHLYSSVEEGIERGMSEQEVVSSVDMSGRNRDFLFSIHNGEFFWFTAKSNLKWAYRHVESSRDEQRSTNLH